MKGGRCESCKGAGSTKLEMNFLPDVWVVCDICKGKRYSRETLEVEWRGKNIFDVLDEDIDVLVELIGGTDDAKTLISSSFEKKIPVVTANKAVIYEYGDILFREASNNGVDFLFEASVCAGTPTINLLKNDYIVLKNYGFEELEIISHE